MFEYNKMLEFPVKIKNKNSRLANIVATQYGGPDCKCLSIRQWRVFFDILELSQKKSMPRYHSNKSSILHPRAFERARRVVDAALFIFFALSSYCCRVLKFTPDFSASFL